MPPRHHSVATQAVTPGPVEGAAVTRALPTATADLAQRWVGNDAVLAGLAAPSGLNAVLAGRTMLAAAGVVLPDAAFASNSVMRRALGRARSGQVDFGTEVGEPLPAAIQARMEQTFGHDFAHVRIHTGARAGEAAAALNAEAVTRGAHIYFAAEAWRPGSPDGDRLLVHELTHVLQGDEGRLPGGGVSEPGDPAEREAYANERALRVGPTEELEGPVRPGRAALPAGGAVLRREDAASTEGAGEAAGGGGAASGEVASGSAQPAAAPSGGATTGTGTATASATSAPTTYTSRAASQAASTSTSTIRSTTSSGATAYSSRAGYQAAGADSAGYATAAAFTVPAGGLGGAEHFTTWVGELRTQIRDTVQQRRESLEEARTWAKDQISTRLAPARERIGAAYDGALASVEERFEGARQDIEGQRNTSRAQAIAAGVLAAMTFEGQRDEALAALDALAVGKSEGVRASARSAADRLAAEYARIRENTRSSAEAAASGSDGSGASGQDLGGALAEVDGAFDRAAADAGARVVAQGDTGAEQIAGSRDAVREEYEDAFDDHSDALTRAFADAVDEVMRLSLEAQTALSDEKIALVEALADSRSEEERALDDLESAATSGVDEGIDAALGVLSTYEEQLLSDVDVVEEEVATYAAVPEAMAALVPVFGENVAACMDNLETYMVDAENTLRTDTQALCGEGERVAEAASARTSALIAEVGTATEALRTEVPGRMTAVVDGTIGVVADQTAGLFDRVAARLTEVDAAWSTTIAEAAATLDGRVAENVAAVERTAASMIADLSQQFAAAPDTDKSVLEQVGDAAQAVVAFAGGLVQGLASGLWSTFMGFLDALTEPLTWVVVGLAVVAGLTIGWPVVIGVVVLGGIALSIKPTADAITEDLRVLFDGGKTAAERGRALGDAVAQLVQFLPVFRLAQEMRAARSFVVLESLTQELGGIDGLMDGLDFANSIDALQELMGTINDGETALYLMDVTGDLATLQGLLARVDAETLAALLREVPDIGVVGELLEGAEGDPTELVALARMVPDDAQLVQLVAKVPDLDRLRALLENNEPAAVLALAGFALDAERMRVWADLLGAEAAAAVLDGLPTGVRDAVSTLGAELLEPLLATSDPARALERYAALVETCELPTEQIVEQVVAEVG